MKPIIIIKEKNKDGKFELTEQELKDLIEQAYEQGVADGRPKATLTQSQYDRPEDGIWYRRNINGGENNKLQTIPHDVFGNPLTVVSGGTASDPRDNRGTLNAEYNDLVYRGWEHREFPKQAEPIPCWLNQTSGQPNPTTKFNSTSVSAGV